MKNNEIDFFFLCFEWTQKHLLEKCVQNRNVACDFSSQMKFKWKLEEKKK